MEQTFYKFFRPMEALGGIIIFSLGVNLFITPVNLYNGGVLGICQLIRSCLAIFLSEEWISPVFCIICLTCRFSF